MVLSFRCSCPAPEDIQPKDLEPFVPSYKGMNSAYILNFSFTLIAMLTVYILNSRFSHFMLLNTCTISLPDSSPVGLVYKIDIKAMHFVSDCFD